MKRIFGGFDHFWSCSETAFHATFSSCRCQQASGFQQHVGDPPSVARFVRRYDKMSQKVQIGGNMLATSGDQQIITRLFGNIDDIGRRSQYDDDGHLIRLGLSHLDLIQLPPEIGQLTYLQKLELNGNRLTELPAELGRLSSLQELALNENRLTHLPAELGRLISLQVLSLFGNQMMQIPTELGQLASLQKLFLNENRLTELPAELEQLKSLLVLT